MMEMYSFTAMLNDIVIPQSAKANSQLVTVTPMKDMRARNSTLSLERVEEFLEAYVDCAKRGVAHVAERPTSVTPILVDVDLAVPSSAGGGHLYTLEDACAVAAGYARAACDMFTVSVPYMEFILLTKPGRVSGRLWKHGFHMHVTNAAVKTSEFKVLFGRVEEVLKDYNFVSGLNAAKAVDDITNKPWLMYGSAKAPGDNTYTASKLIRISIEDGKFSSTVQDYPEEPFIDTVRKLLITIPPAPSAHESLALQIRKTPSPKPCIATFSSVVDDEIQGEEEDECGGDNLDIVDNCDVIKSITALLTDFVSGARANYYNGWTSVAFIITTMVHDGVLSDETGLELFKVFSMRAVKYCETSCNQKWKEISRCSAKGSNIPGVVKLCHAAISDHRQACSNMGIRCNETGVRRHEEILMRLCNIAKETPSRAGTKRRREE